ncbi:hypothetical protein ACWIGM_15645 [Bosea sp. NPDC055332]
MSRPVSPFVLRDIQDKSTEPIERCIAVEDQMKRIEIRSLSSSFVGQLAIKRTAA